jgi:hypothetical protein
MTLPIVGSRYGFATYGWRTADAGGVYFNLADFLLFLDAIGITSTHRFVKTPDNQINIRFPEVDTDLIQPGNVNDDYVDGRYRAQILFSNTIRQNPFFWGWLGHTYQTKTQLNDYRGSIYGNPGAASGYFYACGDSKGIAMFAINNTGLNTFNINDYSFHYFGYCDNPASTAYFGNNNSYPLDYVTGYRGLGNSLGFGRIKEMSLPGLQPPGTVSAQSVLQITSINCANPTPGAIISDLMFRDDGLTDYGTNYPLGRARPFLLFSNQDLAVNSIVRVLNEEEPTPEDHFHIVVSHAFGNNGSILMPIITENYTLP